ncbi:MULTISPECIES: hypothetical protein [Amycolatopsis]|uniref:Uncharacterized protein n=2 Tax=Amycolatopsis TaxID=1813 RepID=A0A1I3MJQ7_9PSEU|nr:hypothetical protein [Amycolatopsis sacchari]SFI97247.1 hypothetical protein SAMN05421835_102366 [Amycolatopsis sacchari]
MIAAVVVVAGGVTTAVVLSSGHKIDAASIPSYTPPPLPSLSVSGLPSSRRSATPSSSASAPSSAVGSAGARGKSTPEELQSAAVAAYTSRQVADFQALSCKELSQSQLDQLQGELASLPADATWSNGAPPQVNGSTGTIHVDGTSGGQTRTAQLPIVKNGDLWCVDA